MTPFQQSGSWFTQSWIGRAMLAVLGWTFLACIFTLPNLSGAGNWSGSFLPSLAQWWSWGLITPLILAADRRLPFSSKQLSRRFLAHVALSVVFTSIYTYVFAAVRALLGIGPWESLLNPKLLLGAWRGMFLWSWLIYWLIAGGGQVYVYYRRYLSSELSRERLERRFSEARLNALRMQLDPHFLFNALNTISAQVERDPKLARRMIGHLGDLLRLSLDSKDRQEVPLAEEMAFLEHYLAIQKIRFGDHLMIELLVAPEVKYASVPCLILQPLVENAIRHGISRRASGGTIIVSAQQVEKHLEIQILDDGVGLPREWALENSSGVGLSVTRERITSLYPEGGSRFAISARASGGTKVEISLPLRVNKEDTHDPAAA